MRASMITRGHTALLALGMLGGIGCQDALPEDRITHITYLSAAVDLDGDGVPADEDCDDQDNTVAPGAKEVPYDGLDQDCDGFDLLDADGDGFIGASVGGSDCNDANPTVHPGAMDMPGDGIDQDCSGGDYVDEDHDGYVAGPGADCDDQNPEMYPGATELIDGLDNDCDGEVDEAPWPGELALEQSGLKLSGASVGVRLAGGLALAGDLDMDGLEDLLIGAGGLEQVLLLPGSEALWGGQPAITVTFQGAAGNGLGGSIGSGGDLDGDGRLDLAFGAPGALDGAGLVYVLPGQSWSAGQVIDLSSAAISLRGGGMAGDKLGQAVLSGIDINLDGLADLVIGAPGVDTDAVNEAGAAYVYLGRDRSALSSAAMASVAVGTIVGVATGDGLGQALAAADLDGDGGPDLVVGAPGSPASSAAHAGQVGLFYGQPGFTGSATLADADAVLFDDDEAASSAGAGASLEARCDLNGDGLPDLVVGVPGAGSSQTPARGRIVVFAGRAARLTGQVALSAANAGYWGPTAGEGVGSSLSCAGDVNGDGYDDLLVGAPTRAGEQGGAWLVFGGPVWQKDATLGQGSTLFAGASAGDHAGAAVAGGDLNGDGLSEVVVGAPDRASSAGALYLFPGAE